MKLNFGTYLSSHRYCERCRQKELAMGGKYVQKKGDPLHQEWHCKKCVERHAGS